MSRITKLERGMLELMLIAVSLALACLVYKTESCKLVTLNFFYLPVVLSGFFLGRYSTGILAVFCVMTTALVCALQLQDFTSSISPLAVGLAVAIWGAILCLTALLVGTLSDERATQAAELHDAYVGVVEVLARYLQGGNPQLNAFTHQVASLSQQIAAEMKLSSKSIDDLRVAALMQGFSNIEITTRVFSKAVHSLQGKGKAHDFSFHGADLVNSLGSVLRGAIPILLNQDSALAGGLQEQTPDPPIGAKILRVVLAYVPLAMNASGDDAAAEAIHELRSDPISGYDADVLAALEHVVSQRQELLAV